ncbi:biotin/lipoyl-binding protein, partial [Pandoraea pneumonica]
YVTALGTVQPLVTATVRTQLAGTLFKLLFTEGQIVRQGQVLAQIDPRPYQLALAQAKANLARDTAQLAAAQVDLNRYETLLKQDSIAS